MSKKLDPSSSVQLEVLEDIPQPCVVTPAAEHKEWYTKRPNRPTQSVKISPSNFGLTPCSKRPQPVGSDDIRAHAQEWEPMTCVVRNQELAGVDGCGPDVRFCYNPTKWDQPQLWSIPCGIPIEIPNCIGRHISKNCWKVKLSTVDFTVPELERFVQSGAYIGLSGSTALEVTEPLVTVDPT